MKTSENQATKKLSNNTILFEVDPALIQRRRYRELALYYIVLFGLVFSIIILIHDKITKPNKDNFYKIIKLLMITSPLTLILIFTLFKLKIYLLSFNRCAILSEGFYPPLKPYRLLLSRAIKGEIWNSKEFIRNDWFIKWSDIDKIIELRPKYRGHFYCELKLKNGFQFYFTSMDLFPYYNKNGENKPMSEFIKFMRLALNDIDLLIKNIDQVPEDYKFSISK